MSGFKLDDYVDVPERIRLFFEKHPEGSLQGDGDFVRDEDRAIVGYIYRARAYRTPDDRIPAVGTAYEPIPGKTPYTKDSEVMNAETSAWGRAIIAAGIPSKKIASAEEVRNRASSESPGGVQSQTSGNGGSGESRDETPRKRAELLKEVEVVLAALPLADSSVDWNATANKAAQRIGGKDDWHSLTVPQLKSLLSDSQKWLANANPAVPF